MHVEDKNDAEWTNDDDGGDHVEGAKRLGNRSRNGLRSARDFVLYDAQERHDEDPARVDVGRDEREGGRAREQEVAARGRGRRACESLASSVDF